MRRTLETDEYTRHYDEQHYFHQRPQEQPRNFHPSYTQKPTPTMQRLAQASELNTSTTQNLDYRYYSQQEIENEPTIPSSHDVLYDPNHPDADWSGLVNREVQAKKRLNYNNHPATVDHLKPAENGFYANDPNSREFKPSKPISQGNIHNTSNLIGGIDLDENERWKTTYKSFENQEKTRQDQLILERRLQRPVGSTINRANITQYKQDFDELNYNTTTYNNSKSLVTPSSHKLRSGGLLSGLGEALATSSSIDTYNPKKTETNSQNSQFSSLKPDTKVLFSDNYTPFPGYTGRKR